MRISRGTLLALFIFVLCVGLNTFAERSVRTVDTVQLHDMVVDNAYRREGGRTEHFVVVDARSKQAYDEAHIFSAISIPTPELDGSMALLPKDKRVKLIVYDNDAVSATKWAEKAAAAGYSNVAVYAAGFHVWKKQKMPVASFKAKGI